MQGKASSKNVKDIIKQVKKDISRRKGRNKNRGKELLKTEELEVKPLETITEHFRMSSILNFFEIKLDLLSLPNWWSLISLYYLYMPIFLL